MSQQIESFMTEISKIHLIIQDEFAKQRLEYQASLNKQSLRYKDFISSVNTSISQKI